ncbi:MAG: L-2-amino-thiazoline-4-carboxylic acid hydrolase [Candidatus Brocadiales bacterium]
MSLVLGPIHHWMHKKIKVSEAREKAIVQGLRDKFGQDAEDLLAEVYQKYPQPQNDGKSLEEMLADQPIHAGIQGLIDDVETREAAIITAFYNKLGDEAKDVASQAAHQHGQSCGQQAVKEKGLGPDDQTPGKAFELLLDNYCDGMPCDRGAQVLDETEKNIVWDHTICIHGKYWEAVNAPSKAMCDILIAWIAGFGKGINSSITHTRRKCIAHGDKTCESCYETG